jgi:hypothetical protein
MSITSYQYQNELNRFKENQVFNKSEKSLFQYFLKKDQESLVAYYLKKQIVPMTQEEKVYFGFANSIELHAVCI